MTPEELKRLRELADAATPGPWTPGRKGSVVAQPDPPNGMWVTVCEGATGTPDGDFILAARTAVPALLDEVRRLRAALAEGLAYDRAIQGYARTGRVAVRGDGSGDATGDDLDSAYTAWISAARAALPDE